MEEVNAQPNSAPRLSKLVLIGLVLSVALNVLLARKVQNLVRANGNPLLERMLLVGSSLPPISAKALDGQAGLIKYPNIQPTVLYVFTPQCSWCFRNLDNLKALVEQDKAQYRFIGLSLSEDSLAAYAAKNQLTLPIYSGLSDETKKAYKLSGTPETIVVSPEGKVQKVWMGAWVGKNQTEIENYFHIKLPGLRDLNASLGPAPIPAH